MPTRRYSDYGDFVTSKMPDAFHWIVKLLPVVVAGTSAGVESPRK